jgi:hypothetical protein
MASTFAELYSDYQDAVKAYTEKLDVNPVSFMRQITRGMQLFQRETEYVERVVTLNKNIDGFWIVPADMLRIVELREYIGDETRPIILNEYTQQSRNMETERSRHSDVPHDWDLRGTNQAGRGGWTDKSKIASLYGRELYMYPTYDGDDIDLYYIPDILAFTSPSAAPSPSDQWQDWFPLETNFNNLFTTARITPSLAPYEAAFLDYAISLFIKSKGSANYLVYERRFYNDIQRAKDNKPSYYSQGSADYYLAPWS